ncbi:hypothetical protein CQ13_34310 [Bradyrhizobium retamae]|uniref:Uncharacterized protein n=1 Tax=Bradyrhizobium retamae TaxID=1300035 RepID=A0A0R3MI15_9BRAD|nr:hypothetical protein CQ13_34310 [Bradyrhizobium retamae]
MASDSASRIGACQRPFYPSQPRSVRCFRYEEIRFEEIIAEIASAFCCASLGIVPTVRHADYVCSWLAVLSWQRLEDLPQALGAIWLDRRLVGKEPDEFASTGFGAEVETALRTRRQWLIEQGLAREEGGQVRFARNMLEARELARISARTGLDHVDAKVGDNVNGV